MIYNSDSAGALEDGQKKDNEEDIAIKLSPGDIITSHKIKDGIILSMTASHNNTVCHLILGRDASLNRPFLRRRSRRKAPYLRDFCDWLK